MVDYSIGNIKLIGYNITHTLTGSCDGSVTNAYISGGTSPYSIYWSGTSSFSAETFDVRGLCEGVYSAKITGLSGNTGVTYVTISGFTTPSIDANLSNNDCVLDPNKLGAITVVSSTTSTASYKYELKKEGKLIDRHFGNTADTSYTFDKVENGLYTLSVIEDRPIQTEKRPNKTGCTLADYTDGGKYSGLSLSSLYAKWTDYVPYAPKTIRFANGLGPNSSGVIRSYNSGLGGNGQMYSNNPYVWFYTGATANRKTDSGKDWYLGTSAITMDEGDNLGFGGLDKADGNVGRFYFNSTLGKYVLFWKSMGWSTTPSLAYGWVTVDPRRDYGGNGPMAVRSVTGSSFGITNVDLVATDYTVNSSGNVAAATNVIANASGNDKFKMQANNGIPVGLLSTCSYNNYTWQLSVNSTDNDDDYIAVVLAAFRDDEGKYGPSGVTHTIDLVLNARSGSTAVFQNWNKGAYGFNKTTPPLFDDCNGGCITAQTTNTFNVNRGNTIMMNTGSATPYTKNLNWDDNGSTRIKIKRWGELGEHFKIFFTDTMYENTTPAGVTKGVGDANPYNSDYDIEFNLFDKISWTGNTNYLNNPQQAPSWASQYSLCKFLGSKKIGVWASSQEDTNWYHFQFTGSSYRNEVIAPLCGSVDGPTTTVTITATTGTTLNLTESNTCNAYFGCDKGVPKVKPRVVAKLQNMPSPSLTVNGLSRPKTTLKETQGGVPKLKIYNVNDSEGTTLKFYFAGKTGDMAFDNTYPTFRIYPYIYQTEQVATIPEYEAIFDTLPSYVDPFTKSIVLSAETYIPFSGLVTGSSWEYIVKPSYLYKDKIGVDTVTNVNPIRSSIYDVLGKETINDVWVDSAKYPPDNTVNNNKDYYMVVVSNPEMPYIQKRDIQIPVEEYGLKIESLTIFNMPEVTATTYSSYTYEYTLENNRVGGPVVVVNGVTLTEGGSGSTLSGPQGDFRFINGQTIKFYTDTVQNGDVLQVIYDAGMGSYIQSLTVPATVPSTSANTSIYQENGYYYIKLDKQAAGAVMVSLNGDMLYNDKDYYKVSENRIFLTGSGSTKYNSGDVINLFYRTIYQVIGWSATKNPIVPVYYTKKHPLEEEVIVTLMDVNGNIVNTQKRDIEATRLGSIQLEFTLSTPTFGTFSYTVSVKRKYPLINGETIKTETNSERISFEITRDVFYSPSKLTTRMQREPGNSSVMGNGAGY